MVSDPITPWQKGGEKLETVNSDRFYFLGSKITVTAIMKLKDACSLEEQV